MKKATNIKEQFSYADYLTWNDDKRWQIIKGDAFCDFPAPTYDHQSASHALARIIGNFLVGKKCKLIPAPFDVIFAEDYSDPKNIYNVVQPDISIFCKPGIIRPDAARGAPDWVIEILSPSTGLNDWNKKFMLYQKYGVKEYWIVDAQNETVFVHLLENGLYCDSIKYEKGSKIKCVTLKGLIIDTKEIFVK